MAGAQLAFSLFSLYSIQSSPWSGPAHTFRVDLKPLEMSLQTHPELCPPGGSKSSQLDSEDWLSHSLSHISRKRVGGGRGPCTVVRWLKPFHHAAPLPDELDRLATPLLLIEKLSVNSDRSLWPVVLPYKNAISRFNYLGIWVNGCWSDLEQDQKCQLADTYPRGVPRRGQSGFNKKARVSMGSGILTQPCKSVTVAAHVSVCTARRSPR